MIYVQSRFYRAPEVILECRYDTAVDIWSFGCLVAELVLGQPLLPGRDEDDQLALMMELLGSPPASLLHAATRLRLRVVRSLLSAGRVVRSRPPARRAPRDRCASLRGGARASRAAGDQRARRIGAQRERQDCHDKHWVLLRAPASPRVEARRHSATALF